jgi:uncharacterized protein YdeI (YjbR/CyaY-like superfamily)
MAAPSKPVRFATAAAFRAWLARYHGSAQELVVRIYKTHARDQGMTNTEAVDEALCFGWIDGVRHALDDVSFTVRFTPRRAKSIWSRVNIRKIEALIAAGRMAKPGLDAYRSRDEARTGLYSFERAAIELAPAFRKKFQARKGAWEHYQTQPPWYRRTTTHWVMSGKQEATRERRLALLIDCSAKKTTIPQLTRSPAAKAKKRPRPR